jgi:hypothetical protein
MIYYTGIGSRNTPEEVCKQMTQLAKHFESMGFILRSGSADGADTAFEIGVSNPINKEIYLPWKNFNGNQSSYFDISQEAFELADTLHPIFKSLKPAIQRLHARNTYQVLGNDLKTPSAFLVCYTPCGSEEESTLTSKSGGTATAIKLAWRRGVPIFNLQTHDAVNRLYEYIGKNMIIIPKVYNTYKDKDKITDSDIYIGRGTPWGNPFVIEEQYTRDNVCNLFEEKTLPGLDVEYLRGKNLVCFCAPARCHGHSIFKKLYGKINPNPISLIPLPLGWSRRDKINPTYEVSSVGDKRFSALYARLSDGRTIEEVYQLSVKGFETITNNWREAKGKPPINGKSFDQLYIDYKNLWILYLSENPKLLFELKARTSARYITDCFASSDVNQAKALFEIIINA